MFILQEHLDEKWWNYAVDQIKMWSKTYHATKFSCDPMFSWYYTVFSHTIICKLFVTEGRWLKHALIWTSHRHDHLCACLKIIIVKTKCKISKNNFRYSGTTSNWTSNTLVFEKSKYLHFQTRDSLCISKLILMTRGLTCLF